MLEVFDLARKVARHFTNVLIGGPTGAGKELVARALHQLSPVAKERFAVCNCSALVDTLLESQLFGHVRGSFTGATDTRPGLFEYANGGTVFLDEIGETSPQMQAKLLRVIQNREIQRVGSPEVRTVDVRLIAATNRDLRAEVLAGRFREDLFFRLTPSSCAFRASPSAPKTFHSSCSTSSKNTAKPTASRSSASPAALKSSFSSTTGPATSASSKMFSPAPPSPPRATSSTSPICPNISNGAMATHLFTTSPGARFLSMKSAAYTSSAFSNPAKAIASAPRKCSASAAPAFIAT